MKVQTEESMCCTVRPPFWYCTECSTFLQFSSTKQNLREISLRAAHQPSSCLISKLQLTNKECPDHTDHDLCSTITYLTYLYKFFFFLPSFIFCLSRTIKQKCACHSHEQHYKILLGILPLFLNFLSKMQTSNPVYGTY